MLSWTVGTETTENRLCTMATLSPPKSFSRISSRPLVNMLSRFPSKCLFDFGQIRCQRHHYTKKCFVDLVSLAVLGRKTSRSALRGSLLLHVT